MGLTGHECCIVQDINIVLGNRPNHILTIEISRTVDIPVFFSGMTILFDDVQYVSDQNMVMLNDALSTVLLETICYQPSEGSYLCYGQWVTGEGITTLQENGMTIPVGHLPYFDQNIGGTSEFNLIDAIHGSGWSVDFIDQIETVEANGQHWKILFQRK